MRTHLLRICAFIALFSVFAAALERQPNADYRARRQALAKLADGGVVVVFAGTEAEGPNALYGFRQDDDFYYLTGLTDPGGAVLVAPVVEATDRRAARPYTEILFLPAHNYSQEKWTGPKLAPGDPQIKEKTGFEQVEPLDRLRDELVQLLPATRARLLVNRGPLSSAPMEWLARANALPIGASVEDAKPLLALLRVRKDAGEFALIRKATDASMAAHIAAIKAMKPGLNEHDIAALMEYEFQKRGCERPAYAPIVGAGFNSTVLHYSADDAPIRDGDLVVLDVGGEYSMYATDITRTLPAHGKFTPRQREIYNIVLGAQEAAIAAFKAGTSTLSRQGENSLYKIVLDYFNTHGKDQHGQPLGQYFIHGLGHNVGLSVHDVGDVNLPLTPGMIFTLEPGIYIPEEKLGVRIEDLFYIDPQGKLVRLTTGLPRSADEVEAAMASR